MIDKNVKVFGPSTIGLATLIGGGLVAGYMISHNFKALGDAHKSKQMKLLWGILTLVQIIAIVQPQYFLLMVYLPIILLYPMLANAIVQRDQTKLIEENFEENEQYSFLESAKVVLVCLAIVLPLSFLLRSLAMSLYLSLNNLQ